MFIDVAKISLTAGNGGNGAVSFRREKYIAAGGPDGGDGGKGGDIYFITDDNLATLADFKYKRKYVAENGKNGGETRCSGKSGERLTLRVPRGTIIKHAETGRLIADISGEEPVMIAKGGRGGWGNSHFATPTRQTPRFSKGGMEGEQLEVVLELKLLADVGLIGYPNVGKSTFISVVSAAQPKIANYHFTTLTPTLGVVTMGEGSSFVVADIPGLIEGAGEGIGLGHEFLRHVDRCRMFIHVLDISGSEGRDPIQDFAVINAELEKWSPELATRPQVVAANKCDLTDDETIERYKQHFEDSGYQFFPIMAAINEGVKPLINTVAAMLPELPPIEIYIPEAPEITEEPDRFAFDLTVDDGVYTVTGPWLERILNSVNPDDYESLQYFQRMLQQKGVIDALIKAGVQDGDTVCVYDIEFDYVS